MYPMLRTTRMSLARLLLDNAFQAGDLPIVSHTNPTDGMRSAESDRSLLRARVRSNTSP